MAQQRLTQEMRRRVTNAVINNQFDGERAKLQKASDAFAMRVYNSMYSKKERDLMASLPEGFLCKTNYFYCNFNGPRDSIRTTECLPVAHNVKDRQAFGADHKCTKGFIALTDQRRDLSKRISEKESEVRGYLAGFKNTKDLLKAWPKLEALMPSGFFEKPVQVPAVIGPPPVKLIIPEKEAAS